MDEPKINPQLFKLLSRGQVQTLIEMHKGELADDYESAEILCDGGQCYLDLRRISTRTVNALINEMLITEHLEGANIRRYTLNSSGRACLQNPEVILKIRTAVETGQPIDL